MEREVADSSYTSSDHFETNLVGLAYLVSLYGAIESTMDLHSDPN